ncbi:MAG: UPF0175 family protein [Cyanobacteria bacterium P01_A01_bin.116]
MNLTITIPDSISADITLSESEIKQELGLVLYQHSKLTLTQARRIAEMSRPDFLQLLASREIPIYDVADFEDDLAILKSIGRL